MLHLIPIMELRVCGPTHWRLLVCAFAMDKCARNVSLIVEWRVKVRCVEREFQSLFSVVS